MPIYEYECPKCGVFEFSQPISEDPIKRCPTCRRAVTKLLSASAFHLKGGGWYSDSYDKSGSKAKSSVSTSTETKSDPPKPSGGTKASSGDAS